LKSEPSLENPQQGGFTFAQGDWRCKNWQNSTDI